MQRFLSLLFCLITLQAVSQDLVITGYNGPTSFDQNTEFVPSITVKNTGIVATTRSTSVAAYLSLDDQWQSTDIRLYNSDVSVAKLNAGQSVTGKPTNARVDAVPGVYYLILQADNYSLVTETDETNNLFVVPNIVVNPSDIDFVISSVITDASTYTERSQIQATYVLENKGSTDAGGIVFVNFVLSKDAVYSDDDQYLYDWTTLLAGPDKFTEEVPYGLVLPDVPLGDYYLLARVDYERWKREEYSETNENNNVYAKRITITQGRPQVSINNIWEATFESSSMLKLSIDVENSGPDATSGYLVEAGLVNESGQFVVYPVRSYETDPLYTYIAGNSRATLRLSFIIYSPNAGTYYPYVRLNGQDQSAFTGHFTPIVISPPPIQALALTGIGVPEEIDNADLTIPLQFQLTNTGNVSGFTQNYSVVIKDAQGATVHTQVARIPVDFNAGQSVSRTVTLMPASPLPAGSYQITASCSGACYSTPTSAKATLTVTPAQYTVTGIVQGEDGAPITKGQLFLYQDNGAGKVQFIQKVVPYQGPSFSFEVNKLAHTLYFIPDPKEYPGYVPTIYGKTISLQESSFFRATANMDVTLEVLKVQPLANGNGIINGYVSVDNPAGKTPKGQPVILAAMDPLPVLLVSASGQVVGITYTNEEGFYEFKNLPRDSYQVVISRELDSPQMTPTTVDLAYKNVRLDVAITPGGVIQPSASQLYLTQTISFDELDTYAYGSPKIALNAQSDQPLLMIEYTSSDPEVATIVNNEIVIHNAGSTEITASQGGNSFYLPAAATRTLEVTPAEQTISFDVLPAQTVETDTVRLSAIASSGLDVSFESSDETIVSIKGQNAVIHRNGVVYITARQAGSRNYQAADDVARQLVVNLVTGIEDIDLRKYAYPNPTTDVVHFTIPLLASVEVFDVLGHVRRDVAQRDDILDFTRVESGVYLVRTSVNNRQTITRIVKK